MPAAEELARIGVALAGDPRSVQVTVGREEVVVRATDVEGGIHLRVEMPVTMPPTMPDLSGASICAAGDTTLSIADSALIGTRRLVEPNPGVLYDAIHELAKTTISAARLLRDLAEYEAAAPEPEPPAEAMISVPLPVTPAPVPAPAPAPTPVATPAVAAVPATTGPVGPVGPFTPTHVVPAGGLPAWTSPDPSIQPAAALDAGLTVQVVEQANGWARILCSNGWIGWVELAKLQPTQ